MFQGCAQGGNGGEIEISASRMNNFRFEHRWHAQAGYSSGKLLLDPDQIILSNFLAIPLPAPSVPTILLLMAPLYLNVNSLNDLISPKSAFHDYPLSQIPHRTANSMDSSREPGP